MPGGRGFVERASAEPARRGHHPTGTGSTPAAATKAAANDPAVRRSLFGIATTNTATTTQAAKRQNTLAVPDTRSAARTTSSDSKQTAKAARLASRAGWRAVTPPCSEELCGALIRTNVLASRSACQGGCGGTALHTRSRVPWIAADPCRLAPSRHGCLAGSHPVSGGRAHRERPGFLLAATLRMGRPSVV